VEREFNDVFARVRTELEDIGIKVLSYDATLKFDESVPFKQLVEAEGDSPSIEIKLHDVADVEATSDVIKKIARESGWSLVVDEPFRKKLLLAEVDALRKAVMEQMRLSLEERISKLEIPLSAVLMKGDPAVSRELLIHIQGVKDVDRFKQFINTPGLLEFRMVVNDDHGRPYEGRTREELLERLGGDVPLGTEIVPEYEEAETVAGSGQRAASRWFLLYKTAPVTGRYLVDAEVGRDNYGQPSVEFRLNPRGGELLRSLTRANIGKMLALVIDGECTMVGMLESEIGSEGMIRGGYTEAEAQRMALVLKSGALPASFHFVSEQTVSQAMIW